MGDGKRERASARLDLIALARGGEYRVKTKPVLDWYRRKTLQELGVVVSEKDLSADEIKDLVDINSMWSGLAKRP